MTSVPQLPVEAPSTKALPKGETPRDRANKQTEEGGEGLFAAVLAQALPERQQAAKAAKTEPTAESKSSKVGGEGIAAEDVEASVVADTQAAPAPGIPAKAVKSEATALAVEARPVLVAVQAEEVAAETLTELGEEQVSVTETLEGQPVGVPAAAPAEGGPVLEVRPAAAEVEVDEARRQDRTQSLNRPPSTPRLETTADKPAAKSQEERRPTERPQEQQAESVHADLKAAAVVYVVDAPAPGAAPVQAVQPPCEVSTAPTKTETLPGPREAGAGAPRLIAETPGASKAELPKADAPPVIEFQVRKETPAQEVLQEPQTADWAREIESEAQPKAAASSKPTETPANTTPQKVTGAPSVEAVPVAKPTEKVVAIAVVAAPEPEPVNAKEDQRARLRPSAEHSDGRRAAQQAVNVAPRADVREKDAQAGRGGSGDVQRAGDESVQTKATPKPEVVRTENVAAVSVDPVAEPERSKQVAAKPTAVAQPAAQAAVGERAAPLNSIPQEASAAPPAEEARPVVSAGVPREPAISAELQQENRRTTLNVVLQDERLGRVALQLVERGGWIETAIRASDPRTVQLLSNGAAGLLEALQHGGLSLAAGNGASAWDAQEGQRRDNPQRDQESQRKRFRLRRSGGEFEGALARAEG